MSITQTMSEDEQYNLEMMQYRLAKLLYDYSIKRKTVDENYIYKVIDIVIAGRSLTRYVKKYEIIRESQAIFTSEGEAYGVASYNPQKQIITLSLEGIRKKIEQFKDTFSHLFDSELEQYLYINYIVTQTILHELEHANQSRLMNEFDGMEPRILRAAVPLEKTVEELVKEKEISIEEAKRYIERKAQEIQKKYYELYKYAPAERLAEIKSNTQLIDVLTHLEVQTERLVNFIYAGVLEFMLKGYTNNIYSPTAHYIKGIGNGEELKQFDWYDDEEAQALLKSQKYTLLEKITNGLPTTSDEREIVALKILTIKYS